MKITALDNVTCGDMGLDPHEDAHQLQDLRDDIEAYLRWEHSGSLDVLDLLSLAWKRGIAFALSGRMDGKQVKGWDWPEEPDPDEPTQDRESYTDDQDRESYMTRAVCTLTDADSWIECEGCGNRYPYSEPRWSGVRHCDGCDSDAYFKVSEPRVGRGPNPAHCFTVGQCACESYASRAPCEYDERGNCLDCNDDEGCNVR